MVRLAQIRSVLSFFLAATFLVEAAEHRTAQVPASIGGYVLAVNAATSPLRIVGFESRREVFKGPYTVIQNTSAHEVSGFRLDAAISAPRQCSSGAEGHGSDRGFETAKILPGRTIRVYWNLVGPANLVWSAKRVNSSYVLVQVAVSEVDFADGTIWKRKSLQNVFLSPEELDKLAPPDCTPWKEMINASENVREVQSREDAPPGYEVRTPTDQKVAFGFSCRIVRNTAICPTGYGMTHSASHR